MAPASEDKNQSTADELREIKSRLALIERDLNSIKSTFRWFAMTVGGAVVLAFVNFILNGGLKLAGGG